MSQVEFVPQMWNDKGPLKGKGVELAQWHRESVNRLEAVRSRMQALAQSTVVVQAWRWCLTLHRSSLGAWRLRWRTSAWRTALWQSIDQQLSTLPPGLAQWYRETHAQAIVLNCREQIARHELRAVLRLASALAATAVTGAATEHGSQ